jgi:hypothetical protein
LCSCAQKQCVPALKNNVFPRSTVLKNNMFLRLKHCVPALKNIVFLRSKTSLESAMWGYGLDRAGSGYGQVAGTCECGNEPSGSIKCGEFLDWLRTG